MGPPVAKGGVGGGPSRPTFGGSRSGEKLWFQPTLQGTATLAPEEMFQLFQFCFRFLEQGSDDSSSRFRVSFLQQSFLLLNIGSSHSPAALGMRYPFVPGKLAAFVSSSKERDRTAKENSFQLHPTNLCKNFSNHQVVLPCSGPFALEGFSLKGGLGVFFPENYQYQY